VKAQSMAAKKAKAKGKGKAKATPKGKGKGKASAGGSCSDEVRDGEDGAGDCDDGGGGGGGGGALLSGNAMMEIRKEANSPLLRRQLYTEGTVDLLVGVAVAHLHEYSRELKTEVEEDLAREGAEKQAKKDEAKTKPVWAAFMQEVKPRVMEENEGMSNTEVMKLVGEMWREGKANGTIVKGQEGKRPEGKGSKSATDDKKKNSGASAGEDDKEDEDEEEDEGKNFDSLTVPELRQACRDADLTVGGTKAVLLDRLRAQVKRSGEGKGEGKAESKMKSKVEDEAAEDDEDEDDEDDEDEAAEDDEDNEGDSFDSLTVPELKQACRDADLKCGGTKAVLLDRLRAQMKGEDGEAEGEAWASNGHPWIGARLRRQFEKGGVYAAGVITHWLKAGGDPTEDMALWRMSHDDGDEEELEEHEVRKAIEAMKRQEQGGAEDDLMVVDGASGSAEGKAVDGNGAGKLDGTQFVGTKVYRYFETGPVAGKVVEYLPTDGFDTDEDSDEDGEGGSCSNGGESSSKGQRISGFWHVLHDDGDEEDLEYDELMEALSAKAPASMGGDGTGGAARESRQPKCLAELMLDKCKLGLPKRGSSKLGQKAKKRADRGGSSVCGSGSGSGSGASGSSDSEYSLGPSLDFIDGAVPSCEWPERVREYLLPLSDLQLHRLCVREYTAREHTVQALTTTAVREDSGQEGDTGAGQAMELVPTEPISTELALGGKQQEQKLEQQELEQQELKQQQQQLERPLWEHRLPPSVFKESAKTSALHAMLPQMINEEGRRVLIFSQVIPLACARPHAYTAREYASTVLTSPRHAFTITLAPPSLLLRYYSACTIALPSPSVCAVHHRAGCAGGAAALDGPPLRAHRRVHTSAVPAGTSTW
jgi:hypothetical protein